MQDVFFTHGGVYKTVSDLNCKTKLKTDQKGLMSMKILYIPTCSGFLSTGDSIKTTGKRVKT